MPEYEFLKSLETLCLSASVSKPHLKSYVLCSGILYGSFVIPGDHEFSLYEHFKSSWLEHSMACKEKNRIPMIHIRDLA